MAIYFTQFYFHYVKTMVVTRVHGLPVLEYLNVLNSFDVSKKKIKYAIEITT